MREFINTYLKFNLRGILKNLHNKFKEILDNSRLSITTKSISTLHPVKNHTIFQKKQSKSFFFFKIVKRIYTFIPNLAESSKIKLPKVKYFANCKILIVSHLINNKNLNSKEDFYFGNLEKILKQNNFSSFKIMINHTNYSSDFLNKTNTKKNVFYLNKNLDLISQIKIIFFKFFSLSELIFLIYKKKLKVNFFFKLATSLFDSSTNFSLIINEQIKYIIKQVKPKIFLSTYEGYSWERLCINGVKTIDENIKCVGYQHTFLTNNHYSIFNKIKGNFNPDQIWCSQLGSFKLLKKKSNLDIKKIFLIGNFKKIPSIKKKNINNKILVIPEGIYSECREIFNFCLKISHKYKKIFFIWRIHPVLNFNEVLKKLNVKKNQIPKNIKISNDNFNNDIKKTSITMYRGSTAVLKSFVMGNFPLYYNSKSEKNFDPLKKFLFKTNYFHDEKSFFKNIKKINNKNYKLKVTKKIRIIKKVFFIKPNIKKLISLLK